MRIIHGAPARHWAAGLLAITVALAGCGGSSSSSSGGGGGGGGGGGSSTPTCPSIAGGTSTTPPVAGKTPTTAAVPSLNPTTTNDPLFPHQWHLGNTGQTAFSSVAGKAGEDIHQTAATMETGAGVKIAIVDTGLELNHEDLRANVVPGASANFNTGGNNPSPKLGGTNCTDHGTSVAGVAAARANNGIGGRGVAGMASLVGYNFLSSNQSLANFLKALGGAAYSADVNVFNQSYGVTWNNMNLGDDDAFAATEDQLALGTANGAIYVKAAGNGDQDAAGLSCAGGDGSHVCQEASFDADNTLPYNIVVGALTAGYGPGNGVAGKASYSTMGSALWVTAPAGEFGVNESFLNSHGYTYPEGARPATVTTDVSGCKHGYAVNYFNIEWALTVNAFNMGGSGNTNCGYTASFNGTSSATPVVSGTVALMLQANSNLDWRDVKHILAVTADPVVTPSVNWYNCGFPTELYGFTTNVAGHQFSNAYGFGRVDVDAAVAMARTFTHGGFETTVAKPLIDTNWVGGPAVNAGIPNCNATGASNMYDPAPTVAFIETVRVRVFLTHPDLSQVAVFLRNNATNTVSRLMTAGNGLKGSTVGYPQNDSLDFATNAFYGESTDGSGFTLTVSDQSNASPTNVGTLNSWQIRVYGHNN